MTSHIEKIQALGNRMVANLNQMGVSASFSDGALTLADKILDIDSSFEAGLLLKGTANIGQTGDSLILSSLLLQDNHFVSGASIEFYEIGGVIFRDGGVTGDSYQDDYLGIEYLSASVSSNGTAIANSQSSEQFLLVNRTGTSKAEWADYADFVNGDHVSVEVVSVTGNVSFYCNNSLTAVTGAGVISKDVTLNNTQIGFKLESGASIVFKEFVVTGDALVDTVSTDSHGLAYTTVACKGAGERKFYSKSGNLLSETYSLFDTILYDVINGYKNTNISIGTGITETDNGEYYTLSSNQANSTTGRYIYSTDITGDFEATFELNITYNSSWAFYFGARTTVDSLTRVSVTGWKYFKFRRVNGVCTAYISSDNENWSEMTMYTDNVGSATCKFQLYIYTSATETARTADFKNLKVYSI